MVERTIESEVEKVFEIIKQDQNFILEGGAGSGKTYSLISIIKKYLLRNRNNRLYVLLILTTLLQRLGHESLMIIYGFQQFTSLSGMSLEVSKKRLKNVLLS